MDFNGTLTEILLQAHKLLREENAQYSKYSILKELSKTRIDKTPLPRPHLKAARQNFIINHVCRKKLPMASKCALCFNTNDTPDIFLVRHHMIPLGSRGTNRRLNIITLCCRCHGYFHPWLSRTFSGMIDEMAAKYDKETAVVKL
jgi:hypothetical protein